MLQNILCISVGASIGAVSRWLLGVALNGLFPLIPMGTLLANLTGGYIIGVMLGVVAYHPEFPQTARLFVITGFLGSLTTFSTFSGEVVLLVMERHFFAASATVALHVIGSLVMTAAGIGTYLLCSGLIHK